MLRFLISILTLAALAAANNTTNVHKVFRITPKNENQVKLLSYFQNVEGFDYWKDPSSISRSADLMVAPQNLKNFISVMRSNGIKFETYIDNVEKLLESQSTKSNRVARDAVFGWKSYHKLEEIYDWLDLQAKLYPNKVKIIVGGTSYEGRQIKGVKLSFGKEKPAVFIEGGIHAREWISHATVTYLINELLTSVDKNIRNLAESFDWYIFPVFNPDGYVYTHIGPKQRTYRLWRKSRSPNFGSKDGCYGTDLNRNWNYHWMDMGGNRDPCSHSYSGSQAFSEIETKSMSEYIATISHKLYSYISFHSYSQCLVFPYGYTKLALDNYEEQNAAARKAVEAISYRYGTTYRHGNVAETLSYASGSSIDYVKGQYKVPFVYVYELRDKGKTGFLLPADEIIPNGEEVMDSLVALFAEAKRIRKP